MENNIISINKNKIKIINVNGMDYFSLTDMASLKQNENLRSIENIENWMRNKKTMEFLTSWESIYNPDFKVGKFTDFGKKISVKKFIEQTGCISLISKSGNNGGTYAVKDIAYEFAMYLSPKIKLKIIQEYDRLKSISIPEAKVSDIEWNQSRTNSKLNFQFMISSIKENLLTNNKKPKQQIFAEEADMLNEIVFGKKAKQWKLDNPKKPKGVRNIRDTASKTELTILSNLEYLSSILMEQKMTLEERKPLLIRECKLMQKRFMPKNKIKITNNKKPNLCQDF